LSYQRGSHYNSIVDPYKATVGVGLGLPSYTPGLAENNLMKEAVSQSEHFQVEQVCLFSQHFALEASIAV
jgi:OTU domain-containing protein 5